MYLLLWLILIAHKIDYGKQSVLWNDSDDDNDVGGYYGNYSGYDYQATVAGGDECSSNDSEADDDESHSDDDDLSSTVDNLTV